MKYKHYSPDAKVVVVNGTRMKNSKLIKEIILSEKNISPAENIMAIGFQKFGSDMDCICKDPEELARIVFDKFREADERRFNLIIVEGVSNKGIGLAVMNRIKKAATNVINNR